MSAAALLAAAAILLGFAAIRDLAAVRGRRLVAGSVPRFGERGRALATGALGIDIAERLLRAGLAGRLSPATVLAAKLCGAGAGAGAGLLAAPAAPGRLGIFVIAAGPAAGFLVPDALLERAARLRRRRLTGALPDALDLLAVAASAGRGTGTAFAEIGANGEGPLAAELGAVAEELACGIPQDQALASLRRRAPGYEIASVTAALERSRRHGSPIADQLRGRATALRRDRRRAISEQAARAAPKIQLVVALVLVPSVLLMIVAGIIANADTLVAGF